MNLTTPSKLKKYDNNRRIAISANVISNIGTVQFVTSHFSFSDLVQCVQAVQLMDWIASFDPNIPKVLVGDFNVYIDFEYPMQFFEGSKELELESNRCKDHFPETQNQNIPKMTDVWTDLNPTLPGFTFVGLNMTHCRSDRIFSHRLKATKVTVARHTFPWLSFLWQRLWEYLGWPDVVVLCLGVVALIRWRVEYKLMFGGLAVLGVVPGILLWLSYTVEETMISDHTPLFATFTTK